MTVETGLEMTPSRGVPRYACRARTLAGPKIPSTASFAPIALLSLACSALVVAGPHAPSGVTRSALCRALMVAGPRTPSATSPVRTGAPCVEAAGTAGFSIVTVSRFGGRLWIATGAPSHRGRANPMIREAPPRA